MSKIKKYSKKSGTTSLILFLILFGYLVFKNISTSIFLKNKDKVNVVFYDENTRLYSIDNNDTDYIFSFTPGSKVLIPGGYGNYRLGAIGKLANLEKDPDLIRRTMSQVTSSMVDLYFYPNSQNIYYENSRKDEYFPSLKEFFMYKSNANLIDKILVFANLFNRNKSLYKIIKVDNSFSSDTFNKDYQGSFYSEILRSEGANIQIQYMKSYQTANLISKIIEGQGIRVVDLYGNDKTPKNCLLIVRSSASKFKTAHVLADFFHCPIKVGETEISDIIFVLGDLEKSWAVK